MKRIRGVPITRDPCKDPGTAGPGAILSLQDHSCTALAHDESCPGPVEGEARAIGVTDRGERAQVLESCHGQPSSQHLRPAAYHGIGIAVTDGTGAFTDAHGT